MALDTTRMMDNYLPMDHELLTDLQFYYDNLLALQIEPDMANYFYFYIQMQFLCISLTFIISKRIYKS